jgi:hypothetical protein
MAWAWAEWASTTRSSVLGRLTRTDWKRGLTPPRPNRAHDRRKITLTVTFAPSHSLSSLLGPCVCYFFFCLLSVPWFTHTAYTGTNIDLLPPLASASPTFLSIRGHPPLSLLLTGCVVCCALTVLFPAVQSQREKQKHTYIHRPLHPTSCSTRSGCSSTLHAAPCLCSTIYQSREARTTSNTFADPSATLHFAFVHFCSSASQVSCCES